MSKTSRRRQAQVPEAQVAANWRATFGEPREKPQAPEPVGIILGRPVVACGTMPEGLIALCTVVDDGR